MTVAFGRSMWRVAYPWFAGALLGFVILFVQSLGGRYGTDFVDAWSWYAPHVLPTLGLIISALIAEQQRKDGRRGVDVSLYRLAFVASCLYVLVLNLTILAIPIVFVSLEMDPFAWLRGANVFIGLAQGVVLGLVGFFFGKAETGRSDRRSERS